MSVAWDSPDLDIAELVDLIVECFDEESDSAKISGSENVRRFEQLMPILVERIEEDLIEYNISSNHTQSELREFLDGLKPKADPGEYFPENFEEFKQQIRAIKSEDYTIAFPLNLNFSPGRKREELTALGYRIERVPRREWISQFEEVAEEAEEEKHQRPSDDPLSSFMAESPNEFRRNYTYWKFNIEARDQNFAIDQLEIVLEYLLGKLNFAAHSGTTEGISIDNSFWPSGWSDLKLPFIYFVFEGDEYTQFYYSEDFTPRDKFSVHSIRRSQFDRYLDEFPEPEQPYNDIEETFVNAVRTFQTAISEPSREDSFLEYWRCAEQLTLADEDDDMKTVIQRAAAPLEHENPQLFQFRLQRARKKRNKLVHEGPDVSIDKEDQNRLKSVLDHLIDLYIEKFDDWDTKDFEFYLDNVGVDAGNLKQKRSELFDQIEILEEVIEAKEYEPEGLQKILLDWARHENELEGAEFLDPLGFYIPVFGVGNDDSDLMVIDRSPVYPLGEDTDPIRERSRVRGPRPNISTSQSLLVERSAC
ncbi:HEPN domain-containing protein [Halorubrum laminariae]|uniref:HEPN domain-containing protein n=1 Tax=Halorubrum laminariae TaxID=1433523 RepID=A0ABD6BZ94_9EURY|nr:HEPN domain-containing protein [Halorubrum laminariae]